MSAARPVLPAGQFSGNDALRPIIHTSLPQQAGERQDAKGDDDHAGQLIDALHGIGGLGDERIYPKREKLPSRMNCG